MPKKTTSTETEIASTGREVAARWTPLLAEQGWTPVCNFFLLNYHRLDVTHGEAMVIIHILAYKWDSVAPFPALKTIGAQMGISASSVRTHLRNLQNKGLIFREMQIGTTNRFHLQNLFLKLEELLYKDKTEKAKLAAARSVSHSGRPPF